MSKTYAEVETMARKATRSVLNEVMGRESVAAWVKDVIAVELTRRDNRPHLVCTDLMDRLAFAQNHEANIKQDIMTWAAMCDTREELERHVVSAEQLAARYVAPVRRRRAA